jgi:hypothetical protein
MKVGKGLYLKLNQDDLNSFDITISIIPLHYFDFFAPTISLLLNLKESFENSFTNRNHFHNHLLFCRL